MHVTTRNCSVLGITAPDAPYLGGAADSQQPPPGWTATARKLWLEASEHRGVVALRVELIRGVGDRLVVEHLIVYFGSPVAR